MGMVWVTRSRLPTSTPPISSRYSNPANHQALSFTMGPPMLAAYCWRRKGGVWPVGVGTSEGWRLGLQCFIAVEDRGGAVNFVGAGFGDDVYDRSPGAAELSGETVGGDLEFLNGVFGNIEQHAADDIVVVVSTIDADVRAAAELSGGRNENRVALGGIEIRCR